MFKGVLLAEVQMKLPLASVLLIALQCLQSVGQDQIQSEVIDRAVNTLTDSTIDPRANRVYQICLSPDRTLVAVRDADHFVRVWSLESREHLYAVEGGDATIQSIDFSPDGRYLITASGALTEGTNVWDAKSGKHVRNIKRGALVQSFDRDGNLVLLDTNGIQVRNVVDGSLVREDRTGFAKGMIPVAVSPRQSMVMLDAISGLRPAQTHHLHKFDLRTKKSTRLQQVHGLLKSVLFSVDSQYVVACCRRYNNVYVISTDTSSPLPLLTGHQKPVEVLALSHDGRHLASGSWDRTIRIWETSTWNSIGVLRHHTSNVTALAFSHDGSKLVSGTSGADPVAIWDLQDILFRSVSDEKLTTVAFFWRQLGAIDPSIAYPALGQLLRSAPSTKAMLSDMLQSLSEPLNQQLITALISQLDDDRYRVREEAFVRLLRLRNRIEEQLAEALRAGGSLEFELQIRRILSADSTRQVTTDPDRRRWLRSIYLLELIDDEQSRQMLAVLESAHPDREIMETAAAALRRLSS